MAPRVLITGGAGFVGFHLARKLVDDGAEVDLADDFSRGARDADLLALASHPAVKVLAVDLSEPGSLSNRRQYDYVYHLAGVVGVAAVGTQPWETLVHNVALAVNTLTLARRQDRLRRFTFASTSEVYAGSFQYALPPPIPTPEDIPLVLPPLAEPRTTYALSKICGEALCQQAGIPFTVLRLHNVYGPRMGTRHVIPELLQRMHEAPEGSSVEVFSPAHTRSFCYIDDAVEQIRSATLSDACAGRTLNVGNPEPEISIEELARLLLEVVGRSLRVVAGPTTPGSPPRRCPDVSRILELTGARPRLGLREGCERTYAWYRANFFSPCRPPSPQGAAAAFRLG